jgi:integrase
MPLKLVQGRHGSPHWYIRGSIRGRRVDESTGLTDQAAAQEVLIKRSAEVLERSIHGDSASRTFAEAVIGYLEHGGEGTHLDPILKEWGRRKIGSLGQTDFEDLARKIGRGKAPATINRQIYTPGVAVLTYAARKGWRPKPVIARPAQPAGRVRWITHQEADHLIASAAPHLQPLVIFLLCTGARLSEALYLDWRFVDLTRGQVIFANQAAGGYGTKSDESRSVPLHPRAVAALANLPWDRRGAVFRRPGQKGQRGADGKLTSRKWEAYADRGGEGGGQVSTAWAAMMKRAKFSDFTPHDCRHTWATWHYAANRDIAALMQLGGWKSPEMVMRYTHVNASHLAPGIGQIWGNDGERPSTVQSMTLIEQTK